MSCASRDCSTIMSFRVRGEKFWLKLDHVRRMGSGTSSSVPPPYPPGEPGYTWLVERRDEAPSSSSSSSVLSPEPDESSPLSLSESRPSRTSTTISLLMLLLWLVQDFASSEDSSLSAQCASFFGLAEVPSRVVLTTRLETNLLGWV